MRDTKTTTPLIAADFVIDQYSSGSLNVQYARKIPTGTVDEGNIEQLPFILGVKGACSIRREAFSSIGTDAAAQAEFNSRRSDEPYTVTSGKTTMTEGT